VPQMATVAHTVDVGNAAITCRRHNLTSLNRNEPERNNMETDNKITKEEREALNRSCKLAQKQLNISPSITLEGSLTSGVKIKLQLERETAQSLPVVFLLAAIGDNGRHET